MTASATALKYGRAGARVVVFTMACGSDQGEASTAGSRLRSRSLARSIPVAVGGALGAERAVAAGLRAVGRRGRSVGQRLPLHAAEVAGAGGMARLAPPGAVALAVVVIHRHGAPRRGARVARVAVHRRAI